MRRLLSVLIVFVSGLLITAGCEVLGFDKEVDWALVHFDNEDRSIYENPCNGDKWYSQSATRREPAMYIFLITDTHMEKWFGKQ